MAVADLRGWSWLKRLYPRFVEHRQFLVLRREVTSPSYLSSGAWEKLLDLVPETIHDGRIAEGGSSISTGRLRCLLPLPWLLHQLWDESDENNHADQLH